MSQNENKTTNNNIIPKTYKLKSELTEKFKDICIKEGIQQNFQVNKMLEQFIDSYEQIGGEAPTEGTMHIASVGDMIKFLQQFPENMLLDIGIGEYVYRLNTYNKTPLSLVLSSTRANKVIEKKQDQLNQLKKEVEKIADGDFFNNK